MPSQEQLPGVINIISDGGLSIPSVNPLANSSILILGFANSGPLNTPILINEAANSVFASNEADAITRNTLFGYSSETAQLGWKFQEAYAASIGAGEPDIRIMRLGLPTAFAQDGQPRGDGRPYGILQAGGVNAIRIIGRYASKIYEKIRVSVESGILGLTYGKTSVDFTLSNYVSVDGLTDAINSSVAGTFCFAEPIANLTLTTKTRKGTTPVLIDKYIEELVESWWVQRVLLGSDVNDNGKEDIGDLIHVVSSQSKDVSYPATGDLGNRTQEFYINDNNGGTIVGLIGKDITDHRSCIFVPRLERIRNSVSVAGGNNPLPSILPFLTSRGGAYTTPTKAVNNTTQPTTQGSFRHTFLGALPVDNTYTLTNAVGAFNVLLENGHADATLAAIDLAINEIHGSGTPDLTLISRTATSFNGVGIDIPNGYGIPGGFYLGLHSVEANVAEASTLNLWTWDYSAATPQWVEVTIGLDGTATGDNTLVNSGFVSFQITGTLAKIYNEGQGLKFLFLTASKTTALILAALYTIIPIHPETYAKPQNNSQDSIADVAMKLTLEGDVYNVVCKNVLDSTAIATAAELAEIKAYNLASILPGSGSSSTLRALLSGNDNYQTDSVYSPTIITTFIPGDPVDIDTVVTSSSGPLPVGTGYEVDYYQPIALADSDNPQVADFDNYNIAFQNYIRYNNDINGTTSIVAAQPARSFGFANLNTNAETIKTDANGNSYFNSKIIFNGGVRQIWGEGHLVVDGDETDLSFVSLDSSNRPNGTIRTPGNYLENYWRLVYYTGATVNLDANQIGYLNGTSTSFSSYQGNSWVGLSPAEKANALSAALDILSGYNVDIIVLSEMYLDETITNTDGTLANAGYHNLLHDFLVKSFRNKNEAVGVVAVKPLTGISTGVTLDRYVRNLTDNTQASALSAARLMENFEAQYGCMSVVVGNCVFQTNASSHTSDGAAAYAGLLAGINLRESTTNKIIPGAFASTTNFTETQQLALMQQRFVVVNGTNTGRIRVVDGVTAAKNRGFNDRSDYVRISTARIIFALKKDVRRVATGYLGQPNSPVVHTSLKADIQGELQRYIDAGRIIDGSADIKANTADFVNGNVFVNLSIIPVLEIRRIIVTTSLRPE